MNNASRRRACARGTGRLRLVAATAIGVVGLIAPTTASAGDFQPTVTINTQYVMTEFSQEQADALDPQLFLDGSDISGVDSLCTESAQAGPGPGGSDLNKVLNCSVNAGSQEAYTITAASVASEAYITRTTCFDPQANPIAEVTGSAPLTFTPVPQGQGSYECFVNMQLKPLLHIDKVIADTGDGLGPLTVSDFEIELYDDADELVPDLQIIDPSSDQCTVTSGGPGGPGGPGGGEIVFVQPNGALVAPQGAVASAVSSDICAEVGLAPGEYTFGEILPTYGYVADGLSCESEFLGELQANAQLPTDDFGVDFAPSSSQEWVCTLSNTYVTEFLTADIVVVNANGGTAQASDFSIEVVDSGDNVVGSQTDPEPGTGNASAQFELPIGPYTLRATGPDGYDVTVSVETSSIETRAVAAPGAFRLDPGTAAVALVTVSDQLVATTTTTTTVAPTTTTATTTTAPTTTAPTTTAAPTTAAPTSQPTTLLPETGTNEQRTTTMLLLALGMLLIGGGAVLATRRI
ncbi:MAG: hypothetical protein AB8G14_16685 [Ilumatobacter sp.]